MEGDTRIRRWSTPTSINTPLAYATTSDNYISNKEPIMLERITDTIKDHLIAHVEKHMLNVELMINNPMTIPEHVDLVEAVESELGKMSDYLDKLAALRMVLGESDL